MTLLLNQNACTLAKPFQLEDAEFVAKNRQVVLGHKTGMGKSLISLIAWSRWPHINRVLILGGKSSASTWNVQPMKWADTQISFIAKPGSWDSAVKSKEGIWFTTYDTFRNCMTTLSPFKRPHWDLVLLDEAHKLRSRKTLWYEQIRRVEFEYLVPMSATWASRGPQDLWSILHLMDRKKFPSYWRFVDRYCFVEDGPFGKEIFGVRNAEELRTVMNGRYYRSRTWKEIGRQFPPTSREVVELPLNKEQQKVSDELDKEMMTSFDGKVIVTPTVLAKLTRLYQLAICPKLLFPSMGYGNALEHILESIEDDPHTVVYTFYTGTIPIIEQALREAGHQNIFVLKGGTSMTKVDATISEWKRLKGVIICSIRFAESFRIDTTNTAYVLGFSWDPNDNIQAEGRLRALDSELQSPVLVKYYIMMCPIMKALREVVNEKVRTVSQIFHDYIEERLHD